MMNRKEFIKTCGYSCIGLFGISFLDGCKPVKYIQSAKENSQLKIARSEFIEVKKNKTQTRRYVFIKDSSLYFPIVLYRFTENDFSALLLECPHQGAELNVYGDLISCSAHGSEFSNKGDIIQGPSEQKLKQYNVTSDTENIYIHLT